MLAYVTLAVAAAAAPISISHADELLLGAHAGFPVERAAPGALTYTYMSVENPAALNLDGSRYGIAVCLSKTSKANWTFSTVSFTYPTLYLARVPP